MFAYVRARVRAPLLAFTRVLYDVSYAEAFNDDRVPRPIPPACIRCKSKMAPLDAATVAGRGDYTATCDGCGKPQGT